MADPSSKNNRSINDACYEGYINIVRLLPADRKGPFGDPRADPSDQGNLAIRNACRGSHPDIVELILEDPRNVSFPVYYPRANPSD